MKKDENDREQKVGDGLFVPPGWVIPKSLRTRKQISNYITIGWNKYHDSYTEKDYAALELAAERISREILTQTKIADSALDHERYLMHLADLISELLNDHHKDTKLEEIFGILGDTTYKLGDATVEQCTAAVGEDSDNKFDYRLRLPEDVLALKGWGSIYPLENLHRENTVGEQRIMVASEIVSIQDLSQATKNKIDFLGLRITILRNVLWQIRKRGEIPKWEDIFKDQRPTTSEIIEELPYSYEISALPESDIDPEIAQEHITDDTATASPKIGRPVEWDIEKTKLWAPPLIEKYRGTGHGWKKSVKDELAGLHETDLLREHKIVGRPTERTIQEHLKTVPEWRAPKAEKKIILLPFISVNYLISKGSKWCKSYFN